MMKLLLFFFSTTALASYSPQTVITDPVTSNTAAVTAGSALKVDNSAVTQPVTGTFWQATQPVSGSLGRTWSLSSGSDSCSAVESGFWDIRNITGTIALPTGAALDSSLQSILGVLPASRGQKTMANSLSCALSSDQSSIPVTGTFWQATQPVSGTVTANAGTGTFTVDASGHTVPVSGTFWQATQPVSAASLPLPSGASTSAKQPALGVAGTASTDVLTVQGIASMTALKVDGSGVTQPVSGTVTANIGTTNGLALDATVSGLQVGQNSTTSGQNGSLAQGAVTTAAPSYTTGKTSPLSLTTSGALRTDASGTTQPVSGTVTSNQGGTWTVQPGNTANTTAWKVDGSAVTQPVSAASLPLPSGASTSAKQPALGTAGSASSDVISVQGVASMTALKTDGSAVTQPVSAASLPLPTGAATSANQTTANTSLSSIDGKTPALGQALAAASVPVVLTASQLSTLTPLTAVTANAGTNLNTSLLALESGGNLATLAGGVSSSKYQYNLAQVAGASTATAASGIQKVGLTDGSGNSITSTAAALDVNLKSATSISAGPTFQTVSGNITTACASGVGCASTSFVALNIQAFTALTVQYSGTYSGPTLIFEQSVDNTNWVGVPMTVMPGNNVSPVTSVSPSANATAQYQGAGWATVNFRVRASAITSGTVAVVIDNTSDNPTFWANVYLLNPIPAGSNLIGKVGIDQTTPGTTNGVQVNAALPAGTNLLGKTGIDQTTPGTTNAVSLSQIGATTIVTGGVNGSQGIGGLAATGATLAGNPVLIAGSDGTNARSIVTDSSGNQAVYGANSGAVAFTTTSVQAVASTDVLNYSWVSVQIAGQGGSSTVTFQGSNDNSTWVTCVLTSSNVTSSVSSVSSTGTGIWDGPTCGRYFRLNVTGIVSGTTSGTIYFFANPRTTQSFGVAAAGITASGSAQGGNPVYIGSRAINAEITPVTNGQAVGYAADLVGKQIIMPYANKENFVSGCANVTTTSATSLISAQAASVKTYITGAYIANTGASNSLITVTDGSGGSTLFTTIAPTVGGSNMTFSPPIPGSAATAVFFTSGTASTTVYICLTGYKGT